MYQGFQYNFHKLLCYNKAGEDIVVMAQTIEKLFLTKIASMPKEEQETNPEVPKPVKKGKGPILSGGVRQVRSTSVTSSTTEQSSVESLAPITTTTPTTKAPIEVKPTLPSVAPNAETPSPTEAPATTIPSGSGQDFSHPIKKKQGVKRKADTTTADPSGELPDDKKLARQKKKPGSSDILPQHSSKPKNRMTSLVSFF